ncbi:MAG: CsbD family protein [Actinomycetia bacterium]|nr:CsbD family protein [Actinomycetes bacterium]
MGASEKTRNVSDQFKGRAKEVAGAVTGNSDLKLRGRAEQASASLRQSFEKLKDAIKL